MFSIFTSHRKREDGFTLIELLVVILIIGILAAIAIPLFLNQRKSAAEASVKSDLKSAATAFETALIAQKAYPTVMPASVKTSNGVSLTIPNKSKFYTTSAMKTNTTGPVDVIWGIDSKGIFNKPNYQNGPASMIPIYFTLDLTCNGTFRNTWRSAADHNITTDSTLWAFEDYVIPWSECPAGTTSFSATISPTSNGTNVASFTPFTLDSSQISSKTSGYCIQGVHSGEPDNIWKYDSLNGGLSQGAC